jgi:hypothetical protein
MSITLTANYKETLAPEVIEIVDELIENGQELPNLLEILDYFGEEYQENLEEIVRALDETGAKKSELQEFIDAFSIDDLEHFEQYNALAADFPTEAIEAFCYIWGLCDLQHFEDSYQGAWDDEAEFAEHICEDLLDHNVPSWIVIDWQATWDSSLRYDYSERDGFYFQDF